MTDAIAVGSILVEKDIHFPSAFLLQSEAGANGWAAIQDTRSGFEKTIQRAGWTFFYMAGQLKATVFGFDGQEALRTAVGRLIAKVKAQHCNGIEITGVAGRSFLKVPYVRVSAHARHLQKGVFFSG